ncbi:MAG: hypothetical protein ACREN6_04070 [Gemmatimonadaceae bacterium]
MKTSCFALALLVAFAPVAGAQVVGTLPDKSPFLDLHDGPQFGFFAGWLATGRDAVGVNAKSAAMIGARYDLSIGGPVYVTGMVFGGTTSRTILDYTKAAPLRHTGSQQLELIDASVGLALSLTGKRTWHHLQPLVNIGAGVVSGLGDQGDISGYSFSTAFQFSYGVGLRLVTSSRSEFRLDVNQYWWAVKYPPLYRSTQGDPVAIKPTGSLSSWTANTGLTLGWSLRAFR